MSLTGQPIEWPEGTVWPPQDDSYGTPGSLVAPFADFGENVAFHEVDDVVIATLRKWLPTYIRHVNETRNPPTPLSAPKDNNYASVLDPDWIKDHRLPGVFAATAKTVGTPKVTADGKYITTFLVVVSAVARARNPQETRRNVSLFELACRMVLVQQKDLGGFALGTKWVQGAGVRPINDPQGKGRWIAEGASQYWVMVESAVQEDTGPTVPDQAPYQDLPQVEDVTTDVESASIEQDEGD